MSYLIEVLPPGRNQIDVFPGDDQTLNPDHPVSTQTAFPVFACNFLNSPGKCRVGDAGKRPSYVLGTDFGTAQFPYYQLLDPESPIP